MSASLARWDNPAQQKRARSRVQSRKKMLAPQNSNGRRYQRIIRSSKIEMRFSFIELTLPQGIGLDVKP